MPSQDLHVRNVVGRYGRGALRGANITASVTEMASTFRIRLEDAANPEAWLEITVDVEIEGTRCASRADTVGRRCR